MSDRCTGRTVKSLLKIALEACDHTDKRIMFVSKNDVYSREHAQKFRALLDSLSIPHESSKKMTRLGFNNNTVEFMSSQIPNLQDHTYGHIVYEDHFVEDSK